MVVLTTGSIRSGVLSLSNHARLSCTNARKLLIKKNVKTLQFPKNWKVETFRSQKTHPGSDFRPPTVKIDVPSNVPVGRKKSCDPSLRVALSPHRFQP